MIVTLTLNPALDKATSVEALVPEKKLRCTSMTVEAGGGGINVSKAVKELGGTSQAIFTSGGYNGQLLENLVRRQNIPFTAIQVEGETRESIIVNERSTNKEFKFIMPGSALTQNILKEVKLLVGQLQTGTKFFVFSGSIPEGVPDDFLAELGSLLKEKGISFIIDTSGNPLKKALAQDVFLIKPNLSELCFLVGTKYLELSEVNDAALQVIDQSKCKNIVVSMGAAGAMLINKEYNLTIPAPQVKKLSTVGAGDSMIGGICFMLQQGKSLRHAVQFAVACGTAATICKEQLLFKKEDAYVLFQRMQNNVTTQY